MNARSFRVLVKASASAKRMSYGDARIAIIAAGMPAPTPPRGACCENERRSLRGGCTSCGDPCL